MRVLFLLLLSAISTFAFAEDELLIYSSRKEHLIKPLCEIYEKEKNVKITLHTADEKSLVEMLVREGPNTKADILMTVDAGNLTYAASKGVLEEVKSDKLKENVPVHLRDANGLWFGLTIRCRTIVYHTKKVDPKDLSTYEDLANPKWKGKLVLRTSKKVYNQSLVAMMIAQHGQDKTKEIIDGWVANLACDVASNDTQVMENIAADIGEVGIVNTYYYGRLIKEKPDLPLKLYWPNQKENEGGVHVNISGAGVVKNSKKQDKAVAFLEWLSGEDAQKKLAELNMEYPVNKKVEPDELVKSWGAFKECEIPLSKAGELQPAAVRLMNLCQYK